MGFRVRLGETGVNFNFIDASPSETDFEIVRAPTIMDIIGGKADTVTVIPYALLGCGKVFTSMTFADVGMSKFPGKQVAYGLRSREPKYPCTNCSYATALYRVPWKGEITISISTQSESQNTQQGKVPGILVQICHRQTRQANTQPATDPTQCAFSVRGRWCQQMRTGHDGYAKFELLGA